MIGIKNLEKSFGGTKVLNSINLEFKEGEIVSIIGPSGSGKSTILRCIIGLEKYECGEITFAVPLKIGMIFQNFNLFPNMTILENLTYAPINVKKLSESDAISIAKRFLDKVGLSNFEDKYPSKLSGGQKQRVAIARTLCMQPDLILVDEPTSSLDPENVKEALETIRQVASTGITMIIVTHEMRFAKEISSRTIFIDHGKVIEDGMTKEVFDNPKSDRLKAFLANVIF